MNPMDNRRALQIVGLVLVAALSYSLLAAVWYVRELHTAVLVIKNDADKRHEVMEAQFKLQQEQIELLSKGMKKLFAKVEPWENCLRFQHKRQCLYNSSLPGEPPCVADILKDLLESLTAALEKANVEHWLTYGTLLGAVREQRIIPWTADVDVMVHTMDVFKKLPQLLNKEGSLHRKGYQFFIDRDYTQMARVCLSDDVNSPLYKKYAQWVIPRSKDKVSYVNGYPYADIYVNIEKTSRQYVSPYGPGCTFPHDKLFPLQKMAMYDKDYFVPNNYTLYLMRAYGPNYMQPPEKKSMHGGSWKDACKVPMQ